VATRSSAPKDHPENSEAGRAAKARDVAADTSTAEVQARVDKETEQGFRGVEVDPTPNENYTVAGVTSGAPTPETDASAAAEAREGQQRAARVVDGDLSGRQ
jgi:hypothetical protein